MTVRERQLEDQLDAALACGANAVEVLNGKIRDRDRMIVALVRHAGGEVRLPRKMLESVDLRGEMEVSEHPEDMTLRLRYLEREKARKRK